MNGGINISACYGHKRMQWLFAGLFMFLTAFSFAQTTAQLYQSAAKLYQQNQFAEAAAAYEKIIAQGGAVPEVYFNLGNCYYKLNNLGKAILNYERAGRLAPDDEDIIHNLKLAQSHAVDKVTPVPQLGVVRWCNDLVCSYSAKGWAMWALASAWMAFIAFTAYLFMASYRAVPRFAGVVLLLLSFTFLFLWRWQHSNVHNSGYAVLVTENIYAKTAPDGAANNAFQIHEGIKFLLLDKVGEWNKIRLADGKVGWVASGSFEKI